MVWASFGNPAIWALILVIVVLLFGTKKLRNVGSDLGEALRNFRKSVKEGESTDTKSQGENQKIEQAEKKEGTTYQGEVVDKDKNKQS